MMKRKMITCILAGVMASCTLLACGDDNGEGSSGASQSASTLTEAEMREDKLVTPFWESDIMYDETVILVAPTDGNGTIIGNPSAKLLFEPEEIIEVKQYFHADNEGVVTFREGEDFTCENGVLTATGDIVETLLGDLVVDTEMPYVTDRQAKGQDAFPGLFTTTGIPSAEGDWDIPFSESYHIVQMQLSVTYRHNGEWTGVKPTYQGDVLSTTVNKLKNKQTVEMLVFGDSVATGANSSSKLNVNPYLPSWIDLTAKKLSRHYGTTVNVTNKSVGGWTSANGISSVETPGYLFGGNGLGSQVGLPKLLETELANYTPDLVIFHFGLNDSTLGVDAQRYYDNINQMISAVRQRNPECDILLLGSIRANMQSKNHAKDLSAYVRANNLLATSYAHTVSLDVGAMQQELLAAGKKYLDMTGNNVNHPNDFLARIYAMNILATLIQ